MVLELKHRGSPNILSDQKKIFQTLLLYFGLEIWKEMRLNAGVYTSFVGYSLPVHGDACWTGGFPTFRTKAAAALRSRDGRTCSNADLIALAALVWTTVVMNLKIGYL